MDGVSSQVQDLRYVTSKSHNGDTDRHTERQTDRHTYRQTDRETDRQSDIERN